MSSTVLERRFEQRLTELSAMWRGVSAPPLALATAAVTWAVESDQDLTSIPAQLDALADELRQRAILAGARQPPSIEALAAGFAALGFRGNEENYYDLRNSLLGEVIARRVGIPITLSVVFIELARRFGLTCEGVNFPGHFLIRYRGADGVVYLDPFRGGKRLDDSGLRRLLRSVRGADAELTAEDLEAAGTRAITLRMLRNLYGIAVNAKDWSLALRAMRMLFAVNPDDARVRGDIGLLYLRLAQWGEALTWLEEQKRRATSDAERQALELRIVEAKAALARWN
ncbi:MAG: hypothetical protein CFK52_01380 [Chloracidobacterium sp. CP2_5A]|nr:MAG: hypothetical protein CFK52_01380 [Chloracidobacterium sp. CP2_5A]